MTVHVYIATGVNNDGHREVLGMQVASSEDGAGWLMFWRDLVARGLTGVKLITSDAHAGLIAAIESTVPGAAWQRRADPLLSEPDGGDPEIGLAGCEGDAVLDL